MGSFEFRPLALHKEHFLELIERRQLGSQIALLAHPLRALVDLITSRKLDWHGLAGLTDGMRIDEHRLRKITRMQIQILSGVYKQTRSRSAKPLRASSPKLGESAVTVLEDLGFSEGLALHTGAAADILAPNLRLLFVAINPSPLSAATLRPFSSPTNAFWRLLFISGLTPVLITPDQSRTLLEFGWIPMSALGRAGRGPVWKRPTFSCCRTPAVVIVRTPAFSIN